MRQEGLAARLGVWYGGLFGTERDDRIDSRRTARREIAGQCGDGQQRHDDEPDRGRIGGREAEQEALDEARKRERERHAKHEPKAREEERVTRVR